MNQPIISNNECQFLFKILLIGNSGVGKSCILLKYTEDNFTTNFYNTIGVDFRVKNTIINNQKVRLQIWDTAGQDRFRTITCSYYRGAHGILVIFDMGDRQSLESVRNWILEIDKFALDSVNKILVGNKSDLNQEVSIEEAQQFADQCKMEFIECSAMTGLNIGNVFETMAKTIMKRIVPVQYSENHNNYMLNNKHKQSQQQQQDNCC